MAENDTWAFGEWWGLLNKELADRGEAEAGGVEARYFHTAGHSPASASWCIASDRKDVAESLAFEG